MTEKTLTLLDLEQMTIADGEGWAITHVRRLLKLVDEIGMETSHDAQALTISIYLHDWGAFARYAQKGIDHALRSRQVAEVEILPYMELSPTAKEVILEAIEHHDFRNPRPVMSNEGLLLREADMLDFLGVIGIVREFAWGPKDLAISLRRILAKRETIQDRFSLPKARQIAQMRLERMAQVLHWLEEESYGIL